MKFVWKANDEERLMWLFRVFDGDGKAFSWWLIVGIGNISKWVIILDLEKFLQSTNGSSRFCLWVLILLTDCIFRRRK